MLQIAEPSKLDARPNAGIAPRNTPVVWIEEEGALRLKIPPGKESLKFTVWVTAERTEGTNATTVFVR